MSTALPSAALARRSPPRYANWNPLVCSIPDYSAGNGVVLRHRTCGRPTVLHASVNYHETILARPHQRRSTRLTVRDYKGVLAFRQGSIPTGSAVLRTMEAIRARIARQVLRRRYDYDRVGTCATFGGLPRPRRTHARSPSPTRSGRQTSEPPAPDERRKPDFAVLYYLTFKLRPSTVTAVLSMPTSRRFTTRDRLSHYKAGRTSSVWRRNHIAPSTASTNVLQGSRHVSDCRRRGRGTNGRSAAASGHRLLRATLDRLPPLQPIDRCRLPARQSTKRTPGHPCGAAFRRTA